MCLELFGEIGRHGFLCLPNASIEADDQPNLVPPLTSTEAVLAYKTDLESIDPSTEYLMTLYLHPDVTPREIKKAAQAGVKGMSLHLGDSLRYQGSSRTRGELLLILDLGLRIMKSTIQYSKLWKRKEWF